MTKFLYLLHFDEPISHAQHYLGITADLNERFERHFLGNGAALTAEFARLKIGFEVARVWRDATQTHERRVKDNRNGAKLCPVCHPFKARKVLDRLEVVPISVLKKSGIQLIYKHES